VISFSEKNIQEKGKLQKALRADQIPFTYLGHTRSQSQGFPLKNWKITKQNKTINSTSYGSAICLPRSKHDVNSTVRGYVNFVVGREPGIGFVVEGSGA
jgi:hypothetical protein